MKVLVVGEESAGIQALKSALKSECEVVAVMAEPEKKSYGGVTMWRVAENLGVNLWPSVWVKDAGFARRVEEAGVDLLLNVHSLYIINSAVIAAPRVGCFNLHPGPLPRYAGMNAPNWAIFRGESSHGVTVHKMEPGIDTGRIVYQSIFEIGENDTALTVSTRCIKEGVAMMVRLLETASRSPSEIPLTPQDLSRREYFKPGAPVIPGYFRALSARQFVNRVRASDYYPLRGPWEGPKVRRGEQLISIEKARVTGEPATAPAGQVGRTTDVEAFVACSDEWIGISKIMIEGAWFNAPEVLTPGDRLEDVTEETISKAATTSSP